MTTDTLPKTEQELNDLIDAKVNEATEKLVAKHNGEMAQQRQKFDADLKKAKEQANMSAGEIAAQKVKEQQEATEKELNELRAYKKSSIISERLQKEGLPAYLKNDQRLLSAEDGDLDKAIKDVKKDYEASLPKGAVHSTVVQTSATKIQPDGGDVKEKAFAAMGEFIKEQIGK